MVDPDQSVRELAAEVLGRAGYSTLQVESGEEALAIAQHERPRVVVTEVCLPGICGYQVCQELKEALGGSVSILFVSETRKERCSARPDTTPRGGVVLVPRQMKRPTKAGRFTLPRP